MTGIRAFGAVLVLAGLLVAPLAPGRAGDGPPPVKPPGVPLGLCSVVDSVASEQQHPCPAADPDGPDNGDGDGPDGGGDGPLGSSGA